MNIPNRERRDWGLIIFIIPIGIFLIVIVGQLAIGIFPNWRLNADMRSNLDPNSAPGQPASLLQPLLPQILTPMAWAESYLTPGSDISFPPFFVIEPTYTASPSPTSVSPTPTTATPTASATPSATVVVTSTTPPPPDLCEDPSANNFGDPVPCTYPPITCQDPLATNFGGALPCTYPPTTCQDPLATNFGGLLPCTYPPTTCLDPLATNFGGLLPCTYPPTGYPSTIDPGYGTPVTPTPAEIGTPGPPDNPYGSFTGIGEIDDGTYIVINLNIVVAPTPDSNYDFVFYEYNNGGTVYLDWIIIGISNDADGSDYYEVFNWGNGTADNNTNIGDVAGSENDNQATNLSELHDPDDPDGTSDNQTGVLIDVDNAASQPPAGTYNYIVVISPNGGSGEAAELDSIEVTEVPIPTP